MSKLLFNPGDSWIITPGKSPADYGGNPKTLQEISQAVSILTNAYKSQWDALSLAERESYWMGGAHD